MNGIYNDRSLEAFAVKRTLKLGAPIGPRLLPRVTCDDEGMFTIYTGKSCRADGCGLQLTSRNRYGTSTLCDEHGREAERARVRRPSTAARRAATSAENLRDPCPHRQAVHRALTGFLNHPMDERIYAHTIEVMHGFELRARLMQAIPRSADDPAPVPPPTDAPNGTQESTP